MSTPRVSPTNQLHHAKARAGGSSTPAAARQAMPTEADTRQATGPPSTRKRSTVGSSSRLCQLSPRPRRISAWPTQAWAVAPQAMPAAASVSVEETEA